MGGGSEVLIICSAENNEIKSNNTQSLGLTRKSDNRQHRDLSND